MLIQLQPKDISIFWDKIKETMIKAGAVPEENKEVFLNSALVNLLSGSFQCWIVYEEGEDFKKDFYAIVITSILQDKLFKKLRLNIDYLYAFKVLTEELYSTGLESLRAFAKANSCIEIATESENAKIARVLVHRGYVGYKKYKLLL